MADKRNNKPAAANPHTRQPFLTELYPGTTPLPDEPQFKDPARIKGEMAERGGSFINQTYHNRRFTGNPNDSSKVNITYSRSKPSIELQLSGRTVPYHSASAEIWRRVTGNNVPTNKELINLQAGDSDYFNKVVQHYTNVPGADYARAGLWRFPVAQMRTYGNKTAIVPEIKEGPQFNGWWNPGAEKGAKRNESTGAIEIIREPVSTTVEDRAAVGAFHSEDEDVMGSSVDTVGHSDSGLGQIYSHEFNHSMSSPVVNPHKYVTEVKYEPTFGITPGSGYEHRWTTVPASGFVTPMYSGVITKSTAYADPYGRVRAQKDSDNANIKPTKHAPQVPSVGMAADYPGFVKPGAIPANPVYRRAPVLYEGETYTGNRKPAGYYAYAYNQDEMTQGLISLNRAQHLLQQNIKKNPQAYIDAGVDPSALGQFMQLPTFLKSPAQLDQRMEFYHNHPEFSALLGQEPSRIIPRYFMLERERRNPEQSQEWRDYHQDLFNFTRANYFMARNGNNQNPMHTGMGKLYNNLA